MACEKCSGCQLPKERLIEVTNAGQKSQMTREQLEEMKNRNDIKVHDNGDSATILHKIHG